MLKELNIKLWESIIQKCIAKGLSREGTIGLLRNCKTVRELELCFKDLIEVKNGKTK